MKEPRDLPDRYLSLWNEPDPQRRSALIEELYTADCAYLLQPPEEMKDIAARPGIGLPPTLEARGYAELEPRAATAYEEFVANGNFRFRGRGDVERLADVVNFRWEMQSPGGEIAAVGLGIWSSTQKAESVATTNSSKPEGAAGRDSARAGLQRTDPVARPRNPSTSRSEH